MIGINERATEYLRGLRRIQRISNETMKSRGHVLLFPDDAVLSFTNHNTVVTKGLAGALDSVQKDLLTCVEILDPLNVDYAETRILMPRTYAESLCPIPHHISVQAIVFSRVTELGTDQVVRMISDGSYGRTSYDRVWIDEGSPRDALVPGETLIVMNRRVGGWDGSNDRPVIELLGGGGHLPTVWDDRRQTFYQMDPVDLILKEFREELKYPLSAREVDVLGGFHNRVSGELVVLCSVFVPFYALVDIQKGALRNFKENTDGIYLGTFSGTMDRYLRDAEPFAGGEEAKDTNFPSQPELMRRVSRKLRECAHEI